MHTNENTLLILTENIQFDSSRPFVRAENKICL